MQATDSVIQFFKQPFSILDQREQLIHWLIWIPGLVMINIPYFEATLGLFHSDDYSLLIPSLYGTYLNAFLFYSNAALISKYVKKSPRKLITRSIILLLTISTLEGFLDSIFFYLFYQSISLPIILESHWGQLLMNGIFFYLPSFIYGFYKAMNRNILESPEKKLVIKNGPETVLISPNELKYVESEGNYCSFYADKKMVVRTSLSKIEKELPPQFIRCHKSFIINIHLIEKQTYQELVVAGHSIPIGRKFRDQVKTISDSRPI